MTALCFIVASGQKRVAYGLPFKSDPEKGLYVGVTEEDVLLGHHKALAMALQEYIYFSASRNSGIQYSMSSSKKADQNDPDKTSTSTNKGYCDVEIVDRTVVNGIEYIMFSIVSGGRYEYEVLDDYASSESGNQSEELSKSYVSLFYTDPATQEKMEWKFAMIRQTVRKGTVTISDHVEIANDIYYEKDK